MANPKHGSVPIEQDRYGLAIEEIKIERSINNMAHLIQSAHSNQRLDYLQEEKAHQERLLQVLKKTRSQH